MIWNSKERRNLLVGLASGLLVLLLLWSGLLQRPEDFLYDLMLLARPAPQPPTDVVVVGIDQKSLDALGRFPWPRRTYAQLVARLSQMGARLIALDLILSEPSPDDDVLAQAIEEAGNVYLSVVRERRGEEMVFLEPVSPLAQAAAGLGHIHLALSGDGIVRALPLTVGPYPALSLRLAQAVRPVDPAAVPTDSKGRMGINFASPGSIPIYSCVDLLNGLVPEDAIAGKIVLVGPTASGLADEHPLPFTIQRELTYGPVMLAHAQVALLQGRFIRPVGLTHHPLFLLLALSIWGWFLGRWSVYRRLLGLTALSVGALLLSLLLMRGGFYLPPLPIVFGGLVSFLGITYLESREVERLVSDSLARLSSLLSFPKIPEAEIRLEEQLVSGVQRLLEPAGVALLEEVRPSVYVLRAARGLPETLPSRFRGRKGDISSLDGWHRVGLAAWLQESRVRSVLALPLSPECPLSTPRPPQKWLVVFWGEDRSEEPEDPALLRAMATLARSRPCLADGGRTLRGEMGRLSILVALQNHLAYQVAILSTTGESISDGIVACDLWGSIYFCNRAMERVGVRTGDWLGKDFRLLMSHLGLIPIGDPLLTDLLKGKIPTWQRELEISTDSRPTYWMVTLSRVLSDPEQPIGLVARFVDITEMRELEKTRADTIAFLAHEVRNPVTAIRGYTYLLQSLPDASADDKSELVQRIDQLADYVAQLVNDFLELTKFEANRIPLRLQPLSLAAAIDEAWQVVEAKAQKKDIRFSVRGASLTVMADPRAMAQILINLLDNAVKYSRPGGQVKVRGRQQEGFAWVDVIDTGIGIPEGELPRLFTKFFRASNARTEIGTGLGLVMVKNLIEAQGGTISVTTKEGEGSTFTFSIPLAPLRRV